jgi:hypothetical protein
MSCRRMSSSNQHYRHNIVTEAIRNAASHAGLSSTREPLYRELDPSGMHLAMLAVMCHMPSSTLALAQLQQTLLSRIPEASLPLAWSSICSCFFVFLAKAHMQGAVAAEARKKQNAASATHRVQGLKFYAFAIESYGFVDKAGVQLMRAFARAASSTGHVTFGGYRASVHPHVSVALCKSNLAISRAAVQMYTRASGHARTDGHLIPTAAC